MSNACHAYTALALVWLGVLTFQFKIMHFAKINTFTDTEMLTVHKNKYTEKLGIKKKNRVG